MSLTKNYYFEEINAKHCPDCEKKLIWDDEMDLNYCPKCKSYIDTEELEYRYYEAN